jgi:hypothetical protein
MQSSEAMFVKWVKDAYPRVFAVAVKRARARSNLGGLGDDLMGDVSVDTSAMTVDPAVTAAVDQAAADQSSSGTDWSSLISSIANAVGTVAPQIVQTQAQLDTIKINQQRASQNMRPITSQSLLTGQGLTSMFSGNTGVFLLVALLGGGLLLASKK